MLCSATIPEEDERLCHTFMNAPTHIEIKAARITTDKIKLTLFEVREEEK